MSVQTVLQHYFKALKIKLRVLSKKVFNITLRLSGFKVLTSEQTIDFLSPYVIKKNPANEIVLPAIENRGAKSALIFEQNPVNTHSAFVWSFVHNGKAATQLPHGGICIRSKVLCTDFKQSGFYQSLKKKGARRSERAKTLIVPWTQFLDGMMFGGYYDFVLLVAAKICRIKDAIPADEFSEAKISYPVFGTPYELEFMNLLDVNLTNVRDSRDYKIDFDRVILANSGHWLYPNSGDILSLKKHIENKTAVKKRNQNRIYVSRSGRRRIVNEDELIKLLNKFDFIVIEDKPRSVIEQVEIYRNASFIIGPHGASFSNILWCEPGTHLFELFSPNYYPDYFLFMAEVLGMKYSAYYYPDNKKKLTVAEALVEDIFVSIPQLEQCLANVFQANLQLDESICI